MLCIDLILPFFFSRGEGESESKLHKYPKEEGVLGVGVGGNKKARIVQWLSWTVEYLRRPEPRSRTRRLINEPKVRRIWSEIASILHPQREERKVGGGEKKGVGRSVSFFILWVIPTATGEKLMSAFQIYDAFPCALNVDFVTLGDTLKT